jgi:hypothetical protein
MQKTTTPLTAETSAADDTKLTTAEKRASTARVNAYLELAQIMGKVLAPVGGVVQAEMGGTKLFLAADPTAVAQAIIGMEHRLKQLEIGFGVLVDMIVQTPLIQGTAHEQEEGSKEPPRLELGFTNLTREQFWLLCARSAEHTTAVMQRGLLSQGAGVAGAVKGILKPN